MPVIIKEKRTIAGKEYDNMHVYKSNKPITKEGRTQAEKLDNILNIKMSKLEKKMTKNGLIKLKNRKGVVELWYNVGKGIEFVNDTEIVPREDRKYIWRARA